MKDKSSFLMLLAASSAIVAVFLLVLILKYSPVSPPATVLPAPTAVPVQSASELDKLSADLDKTDLTVLDKELNNLSSDSSGF